MIQSVLRLLAVLGALLLAGCAANQLPGFQNTYYSYNVPESLLGRIKLKFREYGLVNARIARDNVGRVQLKGSYKNEDEVDRAFIIVQSIVGIKSTSPFYPEDIKETRWGIGAGNALAEHAKANRTVSAKPQKRALIIGINKFLNFGPKANIYGEDDAKVAKKAAEKAGYIVTGLLGERATKSAIEAALRKIEGDLGPDDSLFIYISSHGNPPVQSKRSIDDRKMSIVAWDTSPNKNGKKPNDETDYDINVQETSVSDTLVQRFKDMPTRNTHILIDTCYSGDILGTMLNDESKEYILKTNEGQPERASIAIPSWKPLYVSKGIQYNSESKSTSSTKYQNKSERKDVRYNDATRYTIITATSADQKSWGPSDGNFLSPVAPNATLKGSYFTQFFFEYLRKFNGDVEQSFKAAQDATEIAASKIPAKQVPNHYSTVSVDQNNLYQ